MSKILIVDDHPVVQLAVRFLLEREGHTVVAEANNGIDAFNLAKELVPDLVILDLTLPKLDGLEVISRIRAINKQIGVLVLTSHSPIHFALRCKMAGATGFVWKEDNLTDLVGGVKAVLSGYTYFPNFIAMNTHYDSTELSEAKLLGSLSNREITVLEYLAKGMQNKDIAERILIGEKTVSTYKTRLLLKLNMRTLLELIEFAKRNGISDQI